LFPFRAKIIPVELNLASEQLFHVKQLPADRDNCLAITEQQLISEP